MTLKQLKTALNKLTEEELEQEFVGCESSTGITAFRSSGFLNINDVLIGGIDAQWMKKNETCYCLMYNLYY